MGTKKKWITVDWNEQDIVIASKVGVTREAVRQQRRRLGKPNAVLHKSHARARWSGWVDMNWDLPGSVLALVWNIPSKAMVEVHRRVYCRPRPKYKANARLVVDDVFMALVRAERAKVLRHQSYIGRRRRLSA